MVELMMDLGGGRMQGRVESEVADLGRVVWILRLIVVLVMDMVIVLVLQAPVCTLLVSFPFS